MYNEDEAVVVSLKDLKESSVSFQKLDEAFGPSSLGILIVADLPPGFISLRHKVLSYAAHMANLSPEQLESLSSPKSKYLIGWSHGKETLKSGSYDTMKGSYYVNCDFYQKSVAESTLADTFSETPGYTEPNIWPAESLLPGFRKYFEELCSLIIDVAVLVARACDRYAAAQFGDYDPGCLERIVKTSTTTKARLLHYFPLNPSTQPASEGESIVSNEDIHRTKVADGNNEPHDSWCATHVDHGCLTGLTSALYIDESAYTRYLAEPSGLSVSLPPIPFLPSPPSSSAGLYVHTRTSKVVKVNIPSDCLAFQTGEALQLITKGKFRAVPHFVCQNGMEGMVSRNTLAIFMQPRLEEVVDRATGLTFGGFCQKVADRY